MFYIPLEDDGAIEEEDERRRLMMVQEELLKYVHSTDVHKPLSSLVQITS